ncbi:glycosyl hydrolase catalytic core-domain-containing protein [Pseudomassariella vexata]|uniref:Glycosyl hydrolase catalytic core-domain-containing protein n=1 Tax=Pseudomassariella vexata TaxID=1141098 RepID=A0A1Y2DXZ2_9PEZI|nr:glycosyl hydrolase catalytic core-domain-containing protein [Pseudomassariella vexata]ORY64107.1 glycosyl hydrolase catalytic core-domain-containing protein [Pseudomassariella vexata]
MFAKYMVPALAASASIQGVAAAGNHRHLHQKKDYQVVATEVDIATQWVTVTVTEGFEPTSTSVASSSAPVVNPVESASTTPESVPVAATPSTSDPVAAVATYTTTSTDGVKRGVAYNDASFVDIIAAAAGNKISWCYNWGSTSDGLKASVDYSAMLWSTRSDFITVWDTNAQAAIDAGSTALLSFNEPDNGGQANMDPASAAAGHIQYMNPYASKARISSPAITSSQEAGQGTDWLEQFFTACNGQCSVDFCAAHWYGPGGEEGADEMLAHLLNVQTACQGKNVWLTEFATVSGDSSTFMTRALDQLDNNPTYSFVERYSYFYLAAGSLMDSATSLSTLGQLYASS